MSITVLVQSSNRLLISLIHTINYRTRDTVVIQCKVSRHITNDIMFLNEKNTGSFTVISNALSGAGGLAVRH